MATADLAAGAVDGSKILDAAVANADLANGAVGASKLQDGSVTSAKVVDDTQVGGGLAAGDLAGQLGRASSEIATDGVAALEIQDNSIDSGEIVDFQLTNQDIGVLFAEVNANGTIANSSGSVTVQQDRALGSGIRDRLRAQHHRVTAVYATTARPAPAVLPARS